MVVCMIRVTKDESEYKAHISVPGYPGLQFGGSSFGALVGEAIDYVRFRCNKTGPYDVHVRVDCDDASKRPGEKQTAGYVQGDGGSWRDK